jgi:hypothetical protein
MTPLAASISDATIWSVTFDDTRSVDYYHNSFIIQATGAYPTSTRPYLQILEKPVKTCQGQTLQPILFQFVDKGVLVLVKPIRPSLMYDRPEPTQAVHRLG